MFNHEAHIYCNSCNGENNIEDVEDIINAKNYSVFDYKNIGKKTSNINDNDYIEYVKKQRNIVRVMFPACFI